MRVVALISGGKDSYYNIIQCVSEGHEIVALANLRPIQKDELDSYMFQTVGHQAIGLYSEAMNLPLYRRDISGSSLLLAKDYLPMEGDEVEDLFELLKQVKEELSIEGVSVGAILSNYQRVRVENVCGRLGLTSLGYLWRRDQKELLQEMIDAGVEAVIIKVAALGLTKKHLNMTLQEIQPHMLAMSEKYQLNPCGEGGEYETFVLDCPIFHKRIVIDEFDVIQHDNDPFSPVYYINFKRMHLEDKNIDTSLPFIKRIGNLPIKRGENLLRELGNPDMEVRATRRDNDNAFPLITCSSGDSEGERPTYIKSGVKGYLSIGGIRPQSVLCSNIIDIGMGTMKASLEENGYSLKDVVMVHLFVKKMSQFAVLNDFYKGYFSLNPPVRACVEVDLPNDILFQIDCIAHHQPVGGDCKYERIQEHTMHVQGISHWAPANIGPYSQAKQIGDLIYCAGMIGLCPSSMTLIEGGVHSETVLSLRSVDRVLKAMDKSLKLADVIVSVCYLTDSDDIPLARMLFDKALQEEEHEESIGPAPMTCYVVVPALPKNAAVEWQVTAAIGKKDWQGNCCSDSTEGVNIDAHIAYNTKGGEGVCSATVAVGGALACLDLLSCTQCLASTMAKLFASSTFSWNDVLYLRVFFMNKIISYGSLCSALQQSIATRTSDMPAISAVPVIGLQAGCILMVHAQLQQEPEPLSDDNT